MSPAAEWLLAAAAVVTALSVLWRFLHLGELLKGTRAFLVDWFGSPERPGVDAVPSFPHRIAQVEKRTADLAHDFRGELTSRLTLLAYTVDQLHIAATTAADRFTQLDVRISDHRRRNDEQVTLLTAAIARQEARLDDIRGGGSHRRASDHLPHPHSEEKP